MEYETAGDPISGLKWTRKTTRKIAEQLQRLSIQVSGKTVGKLLRRMRFSLRVNHKKMSGRSNPYRDEQFDYIAKLRRRFVRTGCAIISVDTKKRELVGQFRNPGTAWNRQPRLVKDHDFRSESKGIAIPYGVYDVQANRGFVFIGLSYDTPQFAVDAIERWWRYDGQYRYPQADELLILADAGGSNGPHQGAWKVGIQDKLSQRHEISVTVSHYPPGTSKWNPIEHRLFSEISKNWAGRPLDSYDTILNYARTTTTATGLKVKAYLMPKKYTRGVRIPAAEITGLPLNRHRTLPKWNYTLDPR